ncbi:MAG TPA: hypothetical protein P5305_01385 [Rubrivivax sp.]|nr:hypothetical protein [Rubrivivax sp.]HRY86505.1 hypothetical protein [Rubrivivax sp.]
MKKWFPFISLALFIAVPMAVVLSLMAGVSAVLCHARWGDSGMPSSWGPLKGCHVQLPSGRWVPDDRVRETDLNPK